MNVIRYSRIKTWLTGCILVLGFLSLDACMDEEIFSEYTGSGPLVVEEGIEGNLSLLLASDSYQKRQVMTRNSPSEHSEQHVHSVYVFVIDMEEENHPEQCRIVARKYFPNVGKYLEEVSEGGNKFEVTKLSMPAVSCQKAQIFAIANLGYSEVQGVANDAELLQYCDTLSNLKILMALTAKLTVNEQDEISMERMQGYHLMSGFLRTAEKHNYLDRDRPMVTLRHETDGSLTMHDVQDGRQYRPLGSTGTGIPSAIFVHRLDSKVTVKIKPEGALQDVPGAYFRLVSWQVLNAPTQEHLYWYNPQERFAKKNVKNSKVFRRDLTQDENGGWEFTFYQFESYSANKQEHYPDVNANEIARQYIKEFNWSKNPDELAAEIPAAFVQGYPNKYSNFSYTLRELKEKRKGEDGTQGDYEANNPGNDDQTIVVQNGDFIYAPKEATYLRLECSYFNPQEPARRMADDPRSMKWEKQFPLVDYPYWGEGEIPVATEEKALKRTRSASVTYLVHLGYVGGGNYELADTDIPTGDALKDFDIFQKKLNDYNVLRNHHYTYTLTVSGVENVKLEATREDGGNIYEQEKQPGAEGSVLEAQHYINLDAHYAARNFTIDFTRMPEHYEKGFSFGIFTPFYELRAVLKNEQGKVGLYDQHGNPIEGIRGQDADWIHFAWHGMLDDPSRSLIDPATGNGISYSETYGGYETQQTYLGGSLTQEQDAIHQYKLLNSFEFVQQVWREFSLWKQNGKPDDRRTLTFTVYVDENYYDFNPVTNAQVNWPDFCNKPSRKAFFFMEPDEVSADQNSWYADAHLAIFQQSIQTLYATDASNGQVVANTAFGIEGFDEYRAKYNCEGSHYQGNGNNDQYPRNHYFHGTSTENGLYNTMLWFNNHSGEVIPWQEAMGYYTENSRERALGDSDYQQSSANGRDKRRGEWAIYSRNRDLNRNGKLDADEIRWFVPAIDQYTLCFLGGRPVFENPLFEKNMSVVQYKNVSDWLYGVPVQHFMSSTVKDYNSIFWAEEGCSKGNYGDGIAYPLYGIRMARMLCNHGVEDTGKAFESNMSEDNLLQDALFIVSQTRNGVPVDKEQRVDGKPYYILLNKMNADAFRDYISVGELSEHMHEQKQNWLYREYRIAKNMVGYRSYESPVNYDRHSTVNGIPRTWYQVAGVWSDNNFGPNSIYYYQGEQHSLAFNYYEEQSGSDVFHWRMPNLREAAIMSMAFPESWFPADSSEDPLAITSGTISDNLGQQSTNLPFWIIGSGRIQRLPSNSKYRFYVRPIRDVK